MDAINTESEELELRNMFARDRDWVLGFYNRMQHLPAFRILEFRDKSQSPFSQEIIDEILRCIGL